MGLYLKVFLTSTTSFRTLQSIYVGAAGALILSTDVYITCSSEQNHMMIRHDNRCVSVKAVSWLQAEKSDSLLLHLCGWVFLDWCQKKTSNTITGVVIKKELKASD